jgi:hypothetical protein
MIVASPLARSGHSPIDAKIPLDSYAVESTDNIPQRRRRLSFGLGLAFTINRFMTLQKNKKEQ